jgi:hypothetical protein
MKFTNWVDWPRPVTNYLNLNYRTVNQGRSKAVAREAVAKGAIFLGAPKGIKLSQNN